MATRGSISSIATRTSLIGTPVVVTQAPARFRIICRRVSIVRPSRIVAVLSDSREGRPR